MILQHNLEILQLIERPDGIHPVFFLPLVAHGEGGAGVVGVGRAEVAGNGAVAGVDIDGREQDFGALGGNQTDGVHLPVILVEPHVEPVGNPVVVLGGVVVPVAVHQREAETVLVVGPLPLLQLHPGEIEVHSDFIQLAVIGVVEEFIVNLGVFLVAGDAVDETVVIHVAEADDFAEAIGILITVPIVKIVECETAESGAAIVTQIGPDVEAALHVVPRQIAAGDDFGGNLFGRAVQIERIRLSELAATGVVAVVADPVPGHRVPVAMALFQPVCRLEVVGGRVVVPIGIAGVRGSGPQQEHRREEKSKEIAGVHGLSLNNMICLRQA